MSYVRFDVLYMPWDQDPRSAFDLEVAKWLCAEDVLQRNPFPPFVAETPHP
jgi:hypothetical protein